MGIKNWLERRRERLAEESWQRTLDFCGGLIGTSCPSTRWVDDDHTLNCALRLDHSTIHRDRAGSTWGIV